MLHRARPQRGGGWRHGHLENVRSAPPPPGAAAGRLAAAARGAARGAGVERPRRAEAERGDERPRAEAREVVGVRAHLVALVGVAVRGAYVGAHAPPPCAQRAATASVTRGRRAQLALRSRAGRRPSPLAARSAAGAPAAANVTSAASPTGAPDLRRRRPAARIREQLAQERVRERARQHVPHEQRRGTARRAPSSLSAAPPTTRGPPGARSSARRGGRGRRFAAAARRLVGQARRLVGRRAVLARGAGSSFESDAAAPRHASRCELMRALGNTARTTGTARATTARVYADA